MWRCCYFSELTMFSSYHLMPKTPGSGDTFWSWKQQLVGVSRTGGISWKIMKNMKTGKVSKIPKNNNIGICNFFTCLLFFQNFGNFANFHVFHDFSTDSACPTHSQQLLFSQPGDPSSWQTRGGRSNLYQTWYGHQWFYMITTKHGFSLNSGFTKIWSPPNLPLLEMSISSVF